MRIDGTLRIARRARCVEQADRVPLVTGARPREVRVARQQEVFVLDLAEPRHVGGLLVGDVNHEERLADLLQRGADRCVELAVDKDHLRFAMLERERDGRCIEADVDRVQHGAQHRHGVVNLEVGEDIGRDHRDGVPGPHARFRKRRGEPPASRIELPICELALPVDDRDPVAEEACGAGKEAHGRQRGVVGVALLEFGAVPVHPDLNSSGLQTASVYWLGSGSGA